MHNSLNNYSYFIVCPHTKVCLLIDPTDASICLQVAKTEGYSIQFILNTHDHFDHISGNDEVVAKTGAQVITHKRSMNVIGGVDRGVVHGECLEFGQNIRLHVIETPGHREDHICLLSDDENPVLICGDTLFNAGCGHVRSGNIRQLFKTFQERIATLDDNTLILPGHDYILNNLGFTLSREPNNRDAQLLEEQCTQENPDTRMVTTLATEKKINTFLRLDSAEIFQNLKKDFPAINDNSFEIFSHLRQLRDRW